MTISNDTLRRLVIALTSEGAANDLLGSIKSLPDGGLAGQVLAKISDDNQDVDWTFAGAGGVWGGITGDILNQSDLQSALGSKQDEISASFNQLIYNDSSGDIVGFPGLFREPTNGGLSLNLTLEPDNGGYAAIDQYQFNIAPISNSPNATYGIAAITINLDDNDSGFSFGTAGQAIGVQSANINHQGSGDVGSIQYLTNNFNLGNGTDSIDIKGFGYIFGFGTVNANVTISGAMQGYGYQPNINAAATLDPNNSYTTAFYDFAVINTTHGFYTSYSASPSIEAIANGKSFTGYNLNPTINNFLGNSGFTGLAIGGNYGTFGTGSWNGISANPQTVDDVDNATGLYINMGNVSATNNKAAEFIGDVSINGDLSFTGALSIGQLSAFFQGNPIDGMGNPQSIHLLTSGMLALEDTTVANADTIGVNNAMLITLQENSVSTSGAFKLGFSAVALPCVVQTHAGSSLDFMNMATYALSLDGSSTGGTIGRVNAVRAEAIPNGITTIDEFVAFEFNQTFGQVGTDVWGIHIVPVFAENFIGGSLAIGTSNEKVSNSSVALEIGGATRALLNARMTSGERDLLTAINGMQIYNTTTDKLQVYAGGAWMDLH